MEFSELAGWLRRNERPVLWGLVLVAALTRLALVAGSPQPYGYVYDAYHEGVQVIQRTGRLPAPDACWVCAHPPLFFVLGVLPYAPALRLSGRDLDVALRMLGILPLLCATVAAWSCWRILREYRQRGLPLLAGVALALVLPCLFISSWAPEADILLTALLIAFLERLLRCHLRPRRTTLRDAAVLGLLAGLALLTKYSGALALVWAAAVFGAQALLGPSRRRAVVHGLLVLLVALAVCGPRYVHTYLSQGTALAAQGSAAQGFALLGPRAHWDRYDFGSLRLGEVAALFGPDAPAGMLTHQPVYASVWTTLHAQAWSDMSFFSEPSRNGNRVSPYPRKAIPSALVLLVLVLALAPAALALLGLLLTLRRRPFWPLAMAAATSFAVYAWWFGAQSEWALKTKYLLFLLPAYLVWVAVGLRAALSARPRALAWGATGVLAGLLVATEVYLWVFALA